MDILDLNKGKGTYNLLVTFIVIYCYYSEVWSMI